MFRNAIADNEDRTLKYLRAVRHFAAGDVIGDTRGLNPEFMRRLGMWSAAVGQAYNVGSGYRSIDEQRVLYGRWLAKVPGQAQAAPPGKSMHNFGLASDGPYWRTRNPAAYGLRYPMDFEPWHVEPVEARQMRGGAAPDAGFAMDPLPQPPPVTGLGQVGDVGAAAMDYAYRSALDWAGSQTFGAAPAMGSVLGGGVAAGGRGNLSADEAWIIGKESSGRTTARNPTSTAFGLGQLILANRRTYGSRIGVDPWTTDYGAQLSMMRMYIGERYGNAAAARRFWQANNYYGQGGFHVASYDNGGWLQPGWTAAFNGTGRSERVIDDRGPSTSVIHNFAPNFAPQVTVHAGPGDDGKAIADLVVKAIDRNYSKFAAVVQRRERETA